MTAMGTLGHFLDVRGHLSLSELVGCFVIIVYEHPS